ncbi:hypothetical protein RRG08_046375 [Elysia crispata]|uniref:C-type lectin domain-containing protein n=1 Tax=Elysia crispata TaxID=231223 RepID=A0AAE1AXF7_9GAST|nr:hypothetical protein RRG08_046375 [Elysia crispata]
MNKLCSDLALWISCACLLYYSYYCFGSKNSTMCPEGWIISSESRSCILRDLLINYNRKKEKLVYEHSTPLRYWVGLNDLKQGGVYRWLDYNERATEIPWGQNEPNGGS